MAIKDYSTNPDQNTTINGIYIGEGCSPANLNNAMRQYMADVAEADIAGMAERTEERATAAEEAAQEALSMVSTDAEVSRAWAIGSDAEVPVAGEHSSKEYARIAGSYATVAQNEVSSFTGTVDTAKADIQNEVSSFTGQVNTAKSEIQTLATNSTNALTSLSQTVTSNFNSLATQASTTVNNAKNEAIAAKNEAVTAKNQTVALKGEIEAEYDPTKMYNTGDIVITTRTLSAPDWLPATGGSYLQASYPNLYANVGERAQDLFQSSATGSSSVNKISNIQGDYAAGVSSSNVYMYKIDDDGVSSLIRGGKGAGVGNLARAYCTSDKVMAISATTVNKVAFATHSSGAMESFSSLAAGFTTSSDSIGCISANAAVAYSPTNKRGAFFFCSNGTWKKVGGLLAPSYDVSYSFIPYKNLNGFLCMERTSETQQTELSYYEVTSTTWAKKGTFIENKGITDPKLYFDRDFSKLAVLSSSGDGEYFIRVYSVLPTYTLLLVKYAEISSPLFNGSFPFWLYGKFLIAGTSDGVLVFEDSGKGSFLLKKVFASSLSSDAVPLAVTANNAFLYTLSAGTTIYRITFSDSIDTTTSFRVPKVDVLNSCC